MNFIAVGVTLRHDRSIASLVLELQWCRGDVGGKAPPLHEYVKMAIERGKNVGVGNVRRGIGIWCWRRGDVGGKAPRLREYVKMAVERREKMLR